MEWTQWPFLAMGIIFLLGVWGEAMHKLGKRQGRKMILKREQSEAKAYNIQLYEAARVENIRQHEETRSLVRLALQVMREHTHADGSPATTPIPVDGN